jgi:lysophospholipase L1-like esterase
MISAREDPTVPVPRAREYPWMSIADWNALHAEDVAIANAGGVDLLFVGDSIIQAWSYDKIWNEAFGRHHPANFGIGGDKTQNVLWRLENGDTGILDPRAVVVLVGTNNFGHNDDSAHDVFRGVKAVVEKLRSSFPGAKILVCGIFPFGEKPDAKYRQRIKDANKEISTLQDGTRVFFTDIGDRFLEPDGSISSTVFGDFLHPTPEGYRRWTEAILPTINGWLD